jgi:hypothetical protein
LLAYTEVSQLLKVSVMIEHFNESKQHSGQLTFFDFIKQHYIYDDGNQSDNDTDMKLPFKSHENVALTGVNCPPDISTNLYVSHKENEDQNIFSYKDNLESSYLASIWQPPKIS